MVQTENIQPYLITTLKMLLTTSIDTILDIKSIIDIMK